MSEQILAAATGRRKTAVARVRLTPGTGTIRVNARDMENYFSSDALRQYILQPIDLTGQSGKYDIVASTRGGGISGQAGAIRHALARALLATDLELRTVLKSSGCLTRDSRMKERKKPGQPGARKRFQFSKR